MGYTIYVTENIYIICIYSCAFLEEEKGEKRKRDPDDDGEEDD